MDNAQVGNPQGAAPTDRRQQNGQPATGSSFMSVIRMFVFWYFLSNFFKKKPPQDPSSLSRNLFRKGEFLDVWVYLSEAETFSDYNDEDSLIWYESGIPYAEYGPLSTRYLNYTYYPSKNVQQNGTLFAHLFFAKTGYSPDPSDPSYERLFTFKKTHPLTVFRPPPKIVHHHNLLESSVKRGGAEQQKISESNSNSGENVELEESKRPWVSYWKPNLTIDLVDDFTAYRRDKIPELIFPHINFDEETENYFPTVSVTEFWLLKDKLILMNESVSAAPLFLSLSTLSYWKWQIYLNFEKSAQIQTSMGASSDSEMDELKRAFLEGNPVLLGVTFFVSILHSIFDFLTFKNDIQFWHNNKSMEGLSARTVVLNFFCQFVIFLYLLDNNTSWLIIISSGISLCIEFWKIGKAMDVKIDRIGRYPMLRFAHRESYKMNKTKEYDEIATKYLSYVLYPLVFAYAVYSLIYDSHKSWYSWILTSLTSCVYIFGFIMMCPQLFINYKMKSVAHLPWRQMTYKFLNTIIDDLFAFVIKMPTLHRISVFRDDLVFLIYIYQRWIYPVDKKRVNEFGFDGDEHQGTPSDTSTATAAIAATAIPGEGSALPESAEDDSSSGLAETKDVLENTEGLAGDETMPVTRPGTSEGTVQRAVRKDPKGDSVDQPSDKKTD